MPIPVILNIILLSTLMVRLMICGPYPCCFQAMISGFWPSHAPRGHCCLNPYITRSGPFYLHFTTKEELLATSLETLFVDLGVRTKAESGVEQPSFLKESAAARVLLEHVAEYADLYRVLIGQKGVGYVTHHIITYMTIRNKF